MWYYKHEGGPRGSKKGFLAAPSLSWRTREHGRDSKVAGPARVPGPSASLYLYHGPEAWHLSQEKIPCQPDRDDLPGSVDPFLYVIPSTTVSVLSLNPHPCQISHCAVYNNAPPCLLAGASRAQGSASPPTLTMMVLASGQGLLLAET